jgi:prepilin-type N-terminal cleavage/methylation domain-containing protein/prepilin-type processing-associated H-X9-DG protein
MSRKKNGFTLVELLVVIGIIAVLIGILLPTLAAARRSANNAACLSNARQLTMAAMLFAHEHRGYIPTASDDRWAKLNDPMRHKFAYRAEPSHVDKVVVYDHYSSLIPYLGGKMGQTFLSAPEGQSKVFRCPADNALEMSPPGYKIFNNVAGGYQAVSYGYNADIACLSDLSGVGRFGQGGDSIGVVWGPSGPGYTATIGQPLQCKLNRISKPSEVLLFADCGIREKTGGSFPLDYPDSLYYTTNWMDLNAIPAGDRGKLSGILKTNWLKDRIPMMRHGGKKKQDGTYVESRINVAFADGHAETVGQGDFNKVRVSPYQPR